MKFYNRIFELLEIEPIFSKKILIEIQDQENQMGILFPESVKEWFSIEQSLEITTARDYSVFSILGQKVEKNDLFLFLTDYDLIYDWAFKLENNDDPSVYVRYNNPDSLEEDVNNWVLTCAKFSDFIYLQSIKYFMSLNPHFRTMGWIANEPEVVENLKKLFTEVVTTQNYPAKKNLLFSDVTRTQFFIVEDDLNWSEWYFCAQTTSGLIDLMNSIFEYNIQLLAGIDNFDRNWDIVEVIVHKHKEKLVKDVKNRLYLNLKDKIADLKQDIKVGDYPVYFSIESKKVAITLIHYLFTETIGEAVEGYRSKRKTYFTDNGWILLEFRDYEIYTNLMECINKILKTAI